jgi:hypothetical protein
VEQAVAVLDFPDDVRHVADRLGQPPPTDVLAEVRHHLVQVGGEHRHALERHRALVDHQVHVGGIDRAQLAARREGGRLAGAERDLHVAVTEQAHGADRGDRILSNLLAHPAVHLEHHTHASKSTLSTRPTCLPASQTGALGMSPCTLSKWPTS